MSDQPGSGVDAKMALDAKANDKSDVEQVQDAAVTEYSNVDPNAALSMHVKIHSPFKEYYDEQAFSISAENATGPFDILPTHHSFISLLIPCEITVRTINKGERKIRISGGLMHVKSDKVIVFLDV